MAGLQGELQGRFPRACHFDFSGHGGQALPEAPFSMALFVEDTRRYLDAEGIAKADFFGYSMGGYVALEFARQWPERVGKIATLGTKFDWNPATAAQEAAMLNPEKWLAKAPQFAQMLAGRHAPADWQSLVRHTADLLHSLGESAWVQPPSLPHLTLILLGELDNMVSREESERVAAHMPNARFALLPATKHPFEQVDVSSLAVVLEDFFV
jgi:pimeloyl-ACP methyl ester carboxylesterase